MGFRPMLLASALSAGALVPVAALAQDTVAAAQEGEVHWAARTASYGWGCVPVTAEVAGVPFTTSLIPRDGGYLLPLKVAVRKRAGIALGDEVAVTMTIGGDDA